MSPVTVPTMPKSRRTTPPRSTQIDSEPWEEFGEHVQRLGLTRAGVMRDLVLWWIRWPGAKLPPRPAPRDDQ